MKKVNSMIAHKKSLCAIIFYLGALFLSLTNISCVNRTKERSSGDSYNDVEMVFNDARELTKKIEEDLAGFDIKPEVPGFGLYYKSRNEIYKLFGKYGFSEKTTNQEIESFLHFIKEDEYASEPLTYNSVTSAKSDIYICQRVNYIFVLMIFKEHCDDISLYGFVRNDIPCTVEGWQRVWKLRLYSFY